MVSLIKRVILKVIKDYTEAEICTRYSRLSTVKNNSECYIIGDDAIFELVDFKTEVGNTYQMWKLSRDAFIIVLMKLNKYKNALKAQEVK